MHPPTLISLPTQRPRLERAEWALLLTAAALLALAVGGPPLPGSLHQHAFADHRTLWGLPCTLDVLSNLPFAVAGLWGLVLLRRLPTVGSLQAMRPPLDGVSRALATLFFAGLVCTAMGSALYHARPDDAGLLWDRLGMVLPFAGLLGLAAHSRVSARAGLWAALLTLTGGAAAVLLWARSGELLPWAVVQLGGMVVVLGLAVLPRRAAALAPHLGAVIALYGAAKLLEAADHAVFEATQQWVSGHSIKHLLAAAAAWPVLAALSGWAQPGPVPGGATATPFVTASGQNDAHAVGAAARNKGREA